MSLASPWWLLTLVPWGAMAWWMMRGSGDRTGVPFLELWRGMIVMPRVNRARRPPPMAIVMILVAMLLAILAAAGPSVGPKVRSKITVVLDRGVSVADRPRREAMIKAAKASIFDNLSDGRVELVLVPGGRVETSDWVTTGLDAEGAAIDTSSLLAQAASVGSDPVIVLSDRAMKTDNVRAIQIPPPEPLVNVGIARLSARADMGFQIMITIRNDSPATSATVRLRSGGWAEERRIDLPPTGSERNYFFAAAKLEQVVSAELLEKDDVSADNRAWTVRQSVWPSVDARPGIERDVSRIIEAYARARPTGDGAKRVVVMQGAANQQVTDPAIFVATPSGSTLVRAGDLKLGVHPVIRNVDWAKLGRARVATTTLTSNWVPVISAGDRPLLAIRTEPVRAAWIGFTAENFARDPGFAILWTNLLDWVGEGGATYASEYTHTLEDGWATVGGGKSNLPTGWWPGIFRKGASMVAMNAPAVLPQSVPAVDLAGRLNAIRRSESRSTNLVRPLLLAALASVLVAALTWPVSGRGSGARS